MGPKGSLERFVIAKRKINSIFSFSAQLLEEGSKLLCYVQNVRADLQLKDFPEEVSGLLKRVSSITEVLARDQMKVAFFGSTSNGKSTTLNAMLQDQILPMGTGQTTNCFLSVQGSDQSPAYILKEDSMIERDFESSSQLARALGDDKLQQSSLVQVFLPKTRCKLLSEDVVLVDSPGIDVSADLDLCIDKHCLDADVFVLVVNAESTLTMTEKNFFVKVNQRLSQPNIFILNNRWDASELEPDTMEQVKNQHLQVDICFLVDELKCVDKAQAEERVFFVSSKETLKTRMQKLKGMPQEGGARHGEGFQARQMEFETFERKLEECISKSAIETKFRLHAMSGLNIAKKMKDIMKEVERLASENRSLPEKNKKEHEDQLKCITRPLETCSRIVQRAIEEIQSTVKKQVGDAMRETIGGLRSLVDKFNHPFHPYPSFVKTYIEDLLDHLEPKLEWNMTPRTLTQLINNAQRDMAERLRKVLPQERPENVLQPDATSRDFQASGKVDIRRLCNDFEFKADIEFHFGPEWLEKFLAPYLARLGNVLEANLQRSDHSFVPTAQNNTMSQSTEEVANSAQCVDVAQAIIARLISLASHPGTWVTIVAGGLILKPNYSNLFLIIPGFFGGKYLLQRWTNLAKEKALKRQFIEHATERLRLAEISISANISFQAEIILTSSLSKLESLVQREKQSLEESVIEEGKKITILENIESEATALRNKASAVQIKLSQFRTEFGLA